MWSKKMNRFYRNFDTNFCSKLSRIFQHWRVIEIKYSFIKSLVFEKKLFPLKAVQSYLDTLDKAVKNRTILNHINFAREKYPNERNLMTWEEAHKRIDSNTLYTYIKKPEKDMDDNETIAVIYMDPAMLGFNNNWRH